MSLIGTSLLIRGVMSHPRSRCTLVALIPLFLLAAAFRMQLLASCQIQSLLWKGSSSFLDKSPYWYQFSEVLLFCCAWLLSIGWFLLTLISLEPVICPRLVLLLTLLHFGNYFLLISSMSWLAMPYCDILTSDRMLLSANAAIFTPASTKCVVVASAAKFLQ